LAPFGIWRRSAFGALRHFALFGISRCSAFRALPAQPPFGRQQPFSRFVRQEKGDAVASPFLA